MAYEVRKKERVPSHRLLSVLSSKDYRIVSDETLVELTRRGNNAAFDELVERYCTCIYGLALSILKDEGEAGDALCRAFLAARRDIDSVGGDCSPGTWLYLHGLRAVFQTLKPTPGRYSIVDRARD